MEFRSSLTSTLSICFLIFFTGIGVCPLSVHTASAEEKIVAKVNGTPIFDRQLQGAISEILPQATYHGNLAPEKREALRAQALEDLVKNELFYQAALQQGMKIGKEELDKEIQKSRDRFKSEAEFKRVLKAAGFTGDSYKKEMEKRLLILNFAKTEIIGKAKVSDEYLKEYYEKNKKSYVKPEAFRLRHILIQVPAEATPEEKQKLKKDAEEVLSKALKGEDFEDLAYKYSTDDWRVKGGDLGIVHKGRLDPAIEDAASKLAMGEISGLIETIYGYHIIKLEARYPSAQLSFEEMKDKLRTQLENSRRKELEKSVLKGLKERAKIETF